MRSGIDRSGVDNTIRPQDDLFGHLNGAWLATAVIPEDRGRYGTFDQLREDSEAKVRALLDDAAAHVTPGQHDAGENLGAAVGSLYLSMLDEQRVEARGAEPLQQLLAQVDEVNDLNDFFALLGRLHRCSVEGLFMPYISTDDRASDEYIVYLEQSGLGLPDEAYYGEDADQGIQTAYREHIARMCALIRPEQSTEEHAAAAETIMALESAIASGHWDRVATRDSVKSYTKVTLAELQELAPAIPWQVWADASGAPAGALANVIVRQPSFLRHLSTLLEQTPLQTWTLWLRWRVTSAFAAYLPAAFVAEDFSFNGRVLSGTPELRERGKRATALVSLLMGEAAGHLYVEAHFPQSAKDKMVHLVDNIVAAYRQDITQLTWMSPETRAKALEKLSQFTPKIGYPTRWRDYSGLVMDPHDLFANVCAGYAFECDRDWAKLGQPVDRDEWFMTPQTVNAYYNPGMNEIVFPAAILQPPFFHADADDAVNYGAIGSVIGHEIGHGFDDQGAKYDGRGTLADWWTDEDRAAFEALGAKLIAQYNAFSPRDLPGEYVNGALTLGENIGDLGGVTIAYLAYQLSLAGQEPPVIDGMTGEQRFFAGWAQVWRLKCRTEEARRLLTVDPHSPGEFRANIVRNLTEFHAAFDVQPGDGLWLDEDERVRIW